MPTLFYTTLALIAFAANSVLARLALRGGAIDAASFSTIRLAAGAAALLLVSAYTPGSAKASKGAWTSAVLLFLYAVPFSFAYTQLGTGTGALLLFGCVQITMLIGALWTGERPRRLQWLGLALALAGLVYLVLPGLSAPPTRGAALMALAGFSWGLYSLRGRRVSAPLAHTTSNFTRAFPLAAITSVMLAVLSRSALHARPTGIALAATSGAVASGMGYVAWYAALKGLSATRASIVQLSVPVLAAAGGVVFLRESVSTRLIVSSSLVLGGILLAVVTGGGSRRGR
jgi:drug/metabolite transporter (DMT)-like permease